MRANTQEWLEGYDAQTSGPLRVCGIGDFLSLELPPRVDLLAPWLPRQGLAMIHARRGAGKTFLSLNVAWAVACGSEFLNWRAPTPAGVLYIDGEMPAVALQERLARMALAAEAQPRAALDLITPDLQKTGMPDLASLEGQEAIDACVRQDHALIVVDNLSSLCRAGKENEAESWLTVQTWALRHRAAGRSILFVHHSGKNGLQRGTSRREDVLDTVIQLRQPSSYEISDGARFEIAFEKARGIVGADVEPFEAALGEDANGKPVWSMRSAGRTEQVISMAEDGMKPAEIAAELGVARSTVYRQIRAAVEEGKLPESIVKQRRD
jgi:KaiC/GvpD/RAD55 family RecA-like ATPase